MFCSIHTIKTYYSKRCVHWLKMLHQWPTNRLPVCIMPLFLLIENCCYTSSSHSITRLHVGTHCLNVLHVQHLQRSSLALLLTKYYEYPTNPWNHWFNRHSFFASAWFVRPVRRRCGLSFSVQNWSPDRHGPVRIHRCTFGCGWDARLAKIRHYRPRWCRTARTNYDPSIGSAFRKTSKWLSGRVRWVSY